MEALMRKLALMFYGQSGPAEIYNAGPKGETWASFVFVAAYAKADSAMTISKETFEFERGGSNWAKSLDDAVRCIDTVCQKNSAKISFLRLSCHGYNQGFLFGTDDVNMWNVGTWGPKLKSIAKYCVPGVTFVTLDSCQTGKDAPLLQKVSEMLGGVDVRGYIENQDADADSADNGRGKFVTCKVTVCATGG